MVITTQKLIEIMNDATSHPCAGSVHQYIPVMAAAIHEHLTEPIDDTL